MHACVHVSAQKRDSLTASFGLIMMSLHDTWFIGLRCRSMIQRCCTAVQFSLVCTLSSSFALFLVSMLHFVAGDINFILLQPAEFLEQGLEPCTEVKCYVAAVLLLKHYQGDQRYRWGCSRHSSLKSEHSSFSSSFTPLHVIQKSPLNFLP